MSAVASADIYKLASAMRESAGQSQITTQNVLVNSATYIKADMESRAPVRTGRLRQSIKIDVHQDRIVIGPHTEYAAFVEFGTKPHVIRPKGKKALSFFVGGQRITVKSVNHPGTRAKPFVRPAFEDWVDTLGALVAEANVKRFKQVSE